MNLTEYILYFANACQSSALSLDSQEKAAHYFIGLALDLPNVSDARTHLFDTVFPAYKNDFEQCGRNIPRAFELLLEKQVKQKTVPPGFTENDLKQMCRPGPMEDPSLKGYRHGWTRKCQISGPFLWNNATVLPKKGRKELVMNNKKVDLPSESLQIDAILFFN